MRKVVIETWTANSLEFYFHTDMLFSAIIGESGYLNVFHLREDGKYDSCVTPLGRSIIERVEMIAGVGTVMCGHYGFSITCGKAFDHSEILREALGIIRDLTEDDLDVFTELRKSGTAANVGVFTGNETRLELTQLTA